MNLISVAGFGRDSQIKNLVCSKREYLSKSLKSLYQNFERPFHFLPAFILVRNTIKLLSKARFTFLANVGSAPLVHLLDVLAHVAPLPKLLDASRIRSLEGTIFSVQAHMVDELGSIGKQHVAVASILALENSRAADVAGV